MFIDTHCHLFKEDYENIEEVINEMKDNIIIVSGCSTSTNKEVIELVNKYPNVYGTIGLHPEEANNVKEEDYNFMIGNINNPKIVGIGEIGLDYYYVNDNKDLQKQTFIKQIEIAKEYNKPIVIHSRDSISDTMEILKKYSDMKIVMHCYSSSLEVAKELIKMNVKLGIGGVVTFKNGVKLKEVVENIPLEYLLLETDSPYLSPEPFRGKKNRPYNCYYVAKEISRIKNISLDEVLKITTENAISQFDLNV